VTVRNPSPLSHFTFFSSVLGSLCLTAGAGRRPCALAVAILIVTSLIEATGLASPLLALAVGVGVGVGGDGSIQ